MSAVSVSPSVVVSILLPPPVVVAVSITLSGVVDKPADAVGSSGSEVCGGCDIGTAGGGGGGGIDSAGAVLVPG